MKIVRHVSELPHPVDRTIGFVPTMGAFHQGHLDLMRRAREETDLLVVSLFVNPTQFGPHEDLARYPRQESTDAEMARSVGVDVLFAPAEEEIYPRKTTTVHVAQVTDFFEGESRPGHFDGVATVVAKLFHIVRPTRAYFGRKDLQQCAVIRRMVEDLNFAVRLEICETTREQDGLAMSSRNAYLSQDQRAIAPELYRILKKSSELVKGLSDPGAVEKILTDSKIYLAGKGFEIEYLSMTDTDSMFPLLVDNGNASLVAAVRLGSTRLIDNAPL